MKPRDLHKGIDNNSVFRPQLTSLVDIMVILLFFLIQSFSVEGNLVTPSTDLELPVSTSKKPPQVHNSIDITRTNVIVNDLVVTTNDKIAASSDFLIKDIFTMMQAIKSKSNDPATAGKLLIQADKEVPFAIVKKVMYSCSKAGFDDFKVLVIQDE
jgi:biopolymer transport protein ExbD